MRTKTMTKKQVIEDVLGADFLEDDAMREKYEAAELDADKFERETKHLDDWSYEKKFKQLPKSVKVAILIKEIYRARNLPEHERKKNMEELLAIMRRRHVRWN